MQRHLRGSSLIEVLVALLLLSFGLLAAAGLQARLAGSAATGQQRARAARLLLDFSERLRANPAGAAAGAYARGLSRVDEAGFGGDAMAGCRDACDPAALARADLQAWQARAALQLPDSRLWLVREEGLGRIDLWLDWPATPGQPRGTCADAPSADPGERDCFHLRLVP